MTLDEAIAKYKEITNTDANCPIHCMRSCDKCVQESGQLAEWLEELKSYRASVFSGEMTQTMLKEEYCKAVDDFLEKIQWEYLNGCGIEQKEIEFLIAVSSQVAERLKAGDGE